MKKRKILYIHHGKGLGGAPLSLLYLIQNLDKNKYNPVVLFLHDSQALDLYKSKGIQVEGPLNINDFPHTKIYWFHWYHVRLFLKSLEDTIKTTTVTADCWLEKIKPDLVHLNTSSLVAWAKVAHKKNIPVICHVREPLAEGYFGFRKNFVKRWVEKYSNIIMPICKNDAKPWPKNQNVNVVYNAVDRKVFDKSIKLKVFFEDFPKILFLGGLSKEKGTLEIFKIFKKLLKIMPDVKLLVAGYFDLKLKNIFSFKRYFPVDRYKIKVQKILSKIKNNIIFLGPIENVPEAMVASDLIVFPATVGHFARPVIEAGFMEKPVIASNLPPLDELIIDSKTGFLIDVNKHNLWVEKLHALLTNKNLNKQIGQNAYQHCLQNFDITDQVKKIDNIYQQIIG